MHWGQEHFNVAVMRFRNSPPYVQQQMNWILRIFHTFVRAYVDNIVIFLRTLKEHLQHLHQVFRLFNDIEITLKLKKFYLEYPNITLLEQHVDAFGLTTEKEKMKAIMNLQFSKNLKDLKDASKLLVKYECAHPTTHRRRRERKTNNNQWGHWHFLKEGILSWIGTHGQTLSTDSWASLNSYLAVICATNHMLYSLLDSDSFNWLA